MKKHFLLAAVLALGITIVGCSSTIEEPKDIKSTDDGSLTQTIDKYETVGEIMGFKEDGVHVITGDIVEVFKVDPEKTKGFYLGETVGVVKISDNEFELEKYEVKNFDVRHTNMGELISKASGKIKEVNKNKIVVTTENGDVEFESYGDIFLEKETEVTVEYLEREDGNILIDIYVENSKLSLTIKNISRAEKTGVMVLDTEDKDGMKYEVYVLGRTVLNFNHSDLKVDDEITVYPEVIRESYPAQVDAKMINK